MSSHPPHRNRLLALEQELQTRSSMGDRQTKKKRHEESQPTAKPIKAAAVNAAPTPSAKLPLQKPRQRRAASPETTPPLTPWRVLAARLTQNQPTGSSPPSLETDLTSPRAMPERAKFPRQRSVMPPQQELLPDHPLHTQPLVNGHSPSIDLNDLKTNHQVTTWDSDHQDDDMPLANWQDLASQIQQARSPQSQSPTQQFLQSSPPALIAAESFVMGDFSAINVPELSSQSAIVPSNPTPETAIVPLTIAQTSGALVSRSLADRGILTRYVPDLANSFVSVWRSPQLQRAIPLLAGFILPCVLFKAQFLPSTPSSQVPSTGDTLCVPQKIDSRN